jgi:hypothetical protein
MFLSETIARGGYDDNIKDESSKTLSSVEEYDINPRAWKKAGHLPIAVRSMSSTVSKEKIFVFGGILSDDKETKAIQYFHLPIHKLRFHLCRRHACFYQKLSHVTIWTVMVDLRQHS